MTTGLDCDEDFDVVVVVDVVDAVNTVNTTDAVVVVVRSGAVLVGDDVIGIFVAAAVVVVLVCGRGSCDASVGSVVAACEIPRMAPTTRH